MFLPDCVCDGGILAFMPRLGEVYDFAGMSFEYGLVKRAHAADAEHTAPFFVIVERGGKLRLLLHRENPVLLSEPRIL